MAFHPVTLTTEVNLRYVINGQNCENVFHYKWNSTTPPSTAELTQLATEVYQTIGQRLMNLSHTGVFMREVFCRNIDTVSGEQSTYSQSPPFQGVKTQYQLPNQVAKSIEKKTGISGRSHKGGYRISGLDSSETTGDNITSTLFTLLTNLMLSLIAQRVSGRFIPAVASKLLGDSRTISSLSVPNNIVGSTDTRTANP